MESIERELRAYAEELTQYVKWEFTADEYYEFLLTIYESMRRHHGEEAVAQMSEETVVKVIKSQVKEMVMFKTLPKLMKKRDRIL